jgi:hypothetical protein
MMAAGCIGVIINQSCPIGLKVNHVPEVLAANACQLSLTQQELANAIHPIQTQIKKKSSQNGIRIQGIFLEPYLSTSLKFTRLCDKSDAAARS